MGLRDGGDGAGGEVSALATPATAPPTPAAAAAPPSRLQVPQLSPTTSVGRGDSDTGARASASDAAGVRPWVVAATRADAREGKQAGRRRGERLGCC
eukprot:27702-Chlamydomonas_euryale.AAC.3